MYKYEEKETISFSVYLFKFPDAILYYSYYKECFKHMNECTWAVL